MKYSYYIYILLITLLGCNKPKNNEISKKDYVSQFRSWNSTVGIEKFQKIFSNADIIILGETHNSKRTSQFVSESVLGWKELGFNHFIIETGSYSAKKLEQLMSNKDTKEYIDFLDKYSMPYKDAHPIPFFEGKEDVLFLMKLIQNKFNIHGIDQEFVYAFPYLWDELFEIENRPINAKESLKALQEFAKVAYAKDENSWEYNIYKDFMTNEIVLNYYSAFDELSIKGESLKLAIQESLEIYNANRERNYSHLKRVHYLRNNLDSILKNTVTKDDKIIVKIGRIHAGKTRQLNAYDVGHYIQSYTKVNNKKAVHIGFLRGIYKNDGKTVDYSKNFDSFYFSTYAEKDKWTVIDLNAYTLQLHQNKIDLPDSFTQQLVLSDLENFDYLIIPPLDEQQNLLINKDSNDKPNKDVNKL